MIRKVLHVVHPVMRDPAERVRRLETAKWATPPEQLAEAREALQFARVTAIADLLLQDFTPGQIRELLNRLDDRLLSLESGEGHTESEATIPDPNRVFLNGAA